MKKGIVIGAFFGMIIGVAADSVIGRMKLNKKVVEKDKKISKFKTYYNILNQWMMSIHENKRIDTYFINNGYKTIAIYGMGGLGSRLYEELKDSEIEVRYAIDKNAAYTYSEIEVKSLEDDLEEVDLVVVTAFPFEDIEDELKEKIGYPIVSLEEVIYAM